jgi:Arc/MetJ family transcription regulator
MSRTKIEIDDDLIALVMRRYRVTTKRAAVDLALRLAVGEALTSEEFLEMEGMGWEGDLEDLRRDRVGFG